LKWKLDRTSYYLLIATVLNKREREREGGEREGREREERSLRKRDGKMRPVIS